MLPDQQVVDRVNSHLTPNVWTSISNAEVNDAAISLPPTITLLCIGVQRENMLCMVDQLFPRVSDDQPHEQFGRVSADLEWVLEHGDLKGSIIRISDYSINWRKLEVCAKKLEKVDDFFIPYSDSIAASLHQCLKRKRVQRIQGSQEQPIQQTGSPSIATHSGASNSVPQAPQIPPKTEFAPVSSDCPSYAPHRNPLTNRENRAEPYSHSGPVVRKEQMGIMEIKDMSMYAARWLIKARILSKSELRTFSNQRGEGKLFSVDLMDKSRSMIRATFFNRAAEKFWQELEENKTYLFSRGNLGPANKKFNNLPHRYEIKFDESASILKADDDGDIPDIPYEFIKIKDLALKDKGDIVDVVGIVSEASDVQMISLKAGGEKAKRDLTLVDDSNTSISLTLWGEKASSMDTASLKRNPSICLKSVRIGEYMGKKLEMSMSSQIAFESDNDAAKTLRDWWKKNGRQAHALPVSLSNSDDPVAYKIIEEIKTECSHTNQETLANQGLYFNVRCLLDWIREEKFYWVACPTCWKKVVEADESYDQPGMDRWHCNNCDRNVAEPDYKYILDAILSDRSGTLRCSAMAKYAEDIMGPLKCSDLVQLQRYNGIDNQGRTLDDIFTDIKNTEWSVRVGAKYETYMDETRTKYKIFKATPVSAHCVEESNNIIAFLTLNGALDFKLD